MKSAICTLFEGDYHYGVGALTNSLYHYGFRGEIWVGYRGNLPPWAKNTKTQSKYTQYQVAEGCCINFIKLETNYHFTNYKPHFMLSVIEDYCQDIEAIFYFDPDIVINTQWFFYENWVKYGIALCQNNVDSFMPKDDPRRNSWKEFAHSIGYECQRELNQYFNGGFIGILKKYKVSLEIWKELTEMASQVDFNVSCGVKGNEESLFNGADQHLLNLMAMLTPCPLSTMSTEGMGFSYGTCYMLHALGSPKPWQTRIKLKILRMIKGYRVSRASTVFWKYTQTPIKLFNFAQRFWRKILTV